MIKLNESLVNLYKYNENYVHLCQSYPSLLAIHSLVGQVIPLQPIYLNLSNG